MKKEKKEKHFIHKPIYPGGNKAMKELVARELKYPKEALEHKIEGVVRVRYTIDKDGKVIKTQVIMHLGHGCDEEAERIVKLFKFTVPKNRKIKVHFHKTINIRFKLPKNPTLKVVYEQKASAPSSGNIYNYTISY
jgi:protein TonB